MESALSIIVVVVELITALIAFICAVKSQQNQENNTSDNNSNEMLNIEIYDSTGISPKDKPSPYKLILIIYSSDYITIIFYYGHT